MRPKPSIFAKPAGVAAGTVLAVALAACSSNSAPSSANEAGTASTTGTSSASGTTSALVAKLKAEFKAQETANPDISIAPLSKPVPSGKTVDIITCAVPICALYTEGALDAAAALGWKSKTVVAPFTPEGFKETWDTVLQDKPDAVVMAAVTSTSVVLAQVKQAVAEGIIVVGYGLDVPAGGSSPFTFATTSADDLRLDGRSQALAIINNAGGPANVLILVDPTEPNVIAEAAEDKSLIESVGGTVGEINVNTADIGQGVPAQVVTYLQAHPKVQYVAVPTDDWLPGIAQALASAGLSNVKLLGAGASNSSVSSLQSGQLFSSNVHPTVENGWYLVDAIVRKMVGDPIANANPLWPYVIANQDTVGQLGDLNDWPHITNKFLAAWHVK
jgi:ribose transport system substrate-binding protein